MSYYNSVSEDHEHDIKHFNEHFLKKERELNETLKLRSQQLLNNGINEEWKGFKRSGGINLHIYRNDSLKYWNTNQLPIIRFADIHFPSDGLIHLQNGWYYAKAEKVEDYVLVASFLIKYDFSYENKDLSNSFYDEFHMPFEASINIAEDQGFPVFAQDGSYVLSIIPDEKQEVGYYTSLFLMLFLLFVIIVWLRVLIIIRKEIKSNWRWFIPPAIVGLRAVSLHYSWFSFMEGTVGFDPSVYASNQWFPNLFGLFLNLTILIYVFAEVGTFYKELSGKKNFVVFALPALFLCLLAFDFLVYLTKGLIENSSISMEIEDLFSLSFLSALSAAVIGIYFYFLFQLIIRLIRFILDSNFPAGRLAVILFVISCLHLFYEFYYGDELMPVALFPFIFFGFALALSLREQNSRLLASGMIMLFFFSGVISLTINKFDRKKERAEREVYANQLVTEKSIVTEVEYAILSEKLKNDNFLQRVISSGSNIGLSDLQENLERRYFNGYWEQYDMHFELYGPDRTPLIDKTIEGSQSFESLERILNRSGEQSEIAPTLYYINDYSDQYSYMIKERISNKDSVEAILFCTLKSKKIPEEIGFPRLLISSHANVLESLEKYSIAKYQRNKLITRYGEFNFPFSYNLMLPREDFPSESFFNFGGYNHYLLKKSDVEVVILSKKDTTWISLLTSFSYLFCFYGLLLFPLLFRFNRLNDSKATLTLAMKIQLVLFSLVFVSLLAFGWGSGVFVRNQYNEFTSNVVKEKLSSVETEVKAKLGTFDELRIDENGEYMEFILKKFSRVFFTDINLYDTNGYLLATSRPKVFNMGLISEQMDPEAYSNLKFGLKSGYVHQENIGKLGYASAYQPFYNINGKRLAFINLQHFGQQNEFESQIQQFLVAIINVFILLLAVSLILAILISNWLTAPLRLLQESFASVKFGKSNKRIDYEKDDEIGALVQEYNRKLDELEYTAQQLARSERESAWREMAKQVAHEIKNPLTPMKLSVQHLLRIYDPNDPASREKLERVAGSIIEQIDALTSIANEFSHFAKMPQPHEQNVDLITIISNVIEVFRQTENCEFEFNTTDQHIHVMADKDQMMRVFNNLVKNAVQALSSESEGLIKVDVKVVDDSVVKVRIVDNGSGIPEEQQSKIFVPYFTTKSTGTGLGLAMVKQIIENHRGTIDFESKVGVGTEFIIELPIVK